MTNQPTNLALDVQSMTDAEGCRWAIAAWARRGVHAESVVLHLHTPLDGGTVTTTRAFTPQEALDLAALLTEMAETAKASADA